MNPLAMQEAVAYRRAELLRTARPRRRSSSLRPRAAALLRTTRRWVKGSPRPYSAASCQPGVPSGACQPTASS